jgi:hypothetical protein
MNSLIESTSPSFADRIASLMSNRADLKAASAQLEHLRHEGHAVNTAKTIQGRQDFIPAANFHKSPGAKTRRRPSHKNLNRKL